MIRLRLSYPVSSSSGDSNDCQSSFIDERELKNIPIDPFSQTFVSGHICSAKASDLTASTDWLVLESAEDLFLDIRKGQEDDPTEVRDWEASTSINFPGQGVVSTFRIVAVRKDTAWLELIAPIESKPDMASSDETHLAIPIEMQIEVGNGSWEASLIKKCDLPDGEIDTVTMNLVALLE
jgi:hypothetical protein